MSAPAKSIQKTVRAPQPGPTLEIQDVARGDHRTLRLTGELDLCSTPMLGAAVRRICTVGTATALVLDLGGVEFMDSAGLHTILGAKALCAASQIEFQVLPGRAQVQRLLEITGLRDEVLGTAHG